MNTAQNHLKSWVAYIEYGVTWACNGCTKLQASPFNCLYGKANVWRVRDVVQRMRLGVINGRYILAVGLIIRLDGASSVRDKGN